MIKAKKQCKIQMDGCVMVVVVVGVLLCINKSLARKEGRKGKIYVNELNSIKGYLYFYFNQISSCLIIIVLFKTVENFIKYKVIIIIKKFFVL